MTWFFTASASSQTELSLTDLIQELGPYAQSEQCQKPVFDQLHLIACSIPTENIPIQVREQITALLHDFVARNVEDA